MEQQYLELARRILDEGESRQDRTGVGTLSIFGAQLTADLSQGFPALTTKRLAWRSVVGELLWFLEGTGDEHRLREIMHGSRAGGNTIWTANAAADYWVPPSGKAGDLGRIYGVQWRSWRTRQLQGLYHATELPDGTTRISGAQVVERSIDQIKNIVQTLRTNPTDRRMVLSAFNVGELDQMALPPCHMFAQFYVSQDKKLSCQVYMRSCDVALGLPFNIASYALLTHMLAQVSGLGVGRLIMSLGDAHIYRTHESTMRTQLEREPLPSPQLNILNPTQDIDAFALDDFALVNYQHHAPLQFEMAV